ncbi:MAG: transporter substrate-binding domain-containing protein [Wujia sp.]
MKRIKRLALGAMLVAMGVLSAACGKKEEKRVIHVGMEIGYPPFEFYEEGGEPSGIDVELASALADELNAEVELINTGWEGIFDGLDAGNYDCIISGVTITDERQAKYLFTRPYIQNYQCIVVRSDSDVKPADPSECGGIRLGYQESTTSDEYINTYADEHNMELDPYAYSKIIDAFEDLKQGRIDAIICDSTVADGYLASDGDFYEVSWLADSDPEEFGICVAKDNEALCGELDEALGRLIEDGTVENIVIKFVK